MNQEFLNTYFKNNWNSDLDKYEFCGWSLIDQVFDEEFVIDVGQLVHLLTIHSREK